MSGATTAFYIPCLDAPDTWSVMMREGSGTTSRPWEPERSRQDAPSPAATLPEGAGGCFLLDSVPQVE